MSRNLHLVRCLGSSNINFWRMDLGDVILQKRQFVVREEYISVHTEVS